MVQLSMTLSDLWPRFQGHDIFRHWISQKKRPRLTAKRVEPIVSISWASCLYRVGEGRLPDPWLTTVKRKSMRMCIIIYADCWSDRLVTNNVTSGTSEPRSVVLVTSQRMNSSFLFTVLYRHNPRELLRSELLTFLNTVLTAIFLVNLG